LIQTNQPLVARVATHVRHHVEHGTDWRLLWHMVQTCGKQPTLIDADRGREAVVARQEVTCREAKRIRTAKTLGMEVPALKPVMEKARPAAGGGSGGEGSNTRTSGGQGGRCVLHQWALGGGSARRACDLGEDLPWRVTWRWPSSSSSRLETSLHGTLAGKGSPGKGREHERWP